MKNFLSLLRKSGINISLVDAELSVKFPKGKVNEELLNEIRTRKEELKSYLTVLNHDAHDEIPVIGEKEYYDLSSGQKVFWALSQNDGANASFNMPSFYRLYGKLNRAAFEKSFDALIERHEVLRTQFNLDENGEIKQFILPKEQLKFQVQYEDLTTQNDAEVISLSIVQSEIETAFNLEQGPLLRVRLIQLSEDSFLFSYVVHHIISDGWSIEIMIREFFTLYNAFCQNEENPLLPLRIQYKDFATWQKAQLAIEDGSIHKNYWLNKFNGELPVLNLPTSFDRPTLKTYNGASVQRKLDSTVHQGLLKLCKDQGATLFMGLLSSVNTLLYKYTSQEDIILGTVIAGRENLDLENQLGLYLNTLALRTQFEGGGSFMDLLAKTKEVTLGAYEHQIYPLDEWVNALGLKQDLSRGALFDVSVVLQNTDFVSDMKSTQGLSGLTVEPYHEGENVASKFDLSFTFEESNDGLNTLLVYNTDIYDEKYAERVLSHLEQLCTSIISEPKVPLLELNYLGAAEKVELLEKFNNTTVDFLEAHETLTSLFEAKVETLPDAIAVSYDGIHLTYSELNERSNQLADYLRSVQGIKPNDLVGIQLNRNEQMIIAILGVLKSGAAYLPIDSEYPTERIDYMIEDSRCKFVLDQEELEMFQMKRSRFSKDNLNLKIGSSDLAYVIYTSGSTGKPKGVEVQHSSVLNTILAQIVEFGLNENDNCAQFASFSFDASVWETFLALLSGASLCIVPKDEHLSPELYVDFLNKNLISIVTLPPSFLNQLEVDSITSLRTLITAGEAPRHDKIEEVVKVADYYNAYGPTETSICATTYKVSKGSSVATGNISIGKPIANTEIYIVDAALNSVAIGVVGEICVSGNGLAKGYLWNTDLTNEKFVENPFKQGCKMYKSGDLGRWKSDGNIEFIGRKDDQVKIRGHRIEFGEIEETLKRFEKVESILVLALPNKFEENELIAYVTGSEDLNSSELKGYLNDFLPSYMIPSHFVQIKEFPLTHNGKIDKKRLPNPDGLALGTGKAYVAPTNEVEALLIQIWGGILGIEKIGIHDDFFELGGDSIKILRVTGELRKALNIEVRFPDLYKNTTVQGLSTHIIENRKKLDQLSEKKKEERKLAIKELDELKARILDTFEDSVRDSIEDVYPMSAIEKGMVYESLLNSKVYHDIMVHQKSFVDFDKDLFLKAIELMVDKHSILRTSFNLSDFETEVQIVQKKINIPFTYKDISLLTRKDQEEYLLAYQDSQIEIPFDFTKAPIWRMSLFNLGANNFGFIFQCSHAIIDGWSDSSLMTELNNVYFKLKESPSFIPIPLKSSYKDHIIELEIDKRDEDVKEFWKNELADYHRSDFFTEKDNIQAFTCQFEEEFRASIERCSTKLNLPIKTIALSAYLYMLSMLDYEDEFVVGLVSNLRPNCDDADKILGCFLNTIPLKVKVESELNGGAFAQKVNEKLTALKEYERLSLVEIAQLHKSNARGGNPFFDVIFNYVDFHAFRSIENDTTQDSNEIALPPGSGITNTFMDLFVNVTDGVFEATVSLSKELKNGFTAEKIADLYKLALLQIVQNSGESLGKGMLNAMSKDGQLLNTFNDTDSAFNYENTIVRRFESQVEKTPDVIAVVVDEISMTYAELNDTSNQLANYLKDRYSIESNDLVGIQLNRDEWMVPSILAVLKTGAAYVPIDVDYPQSRIDYMISNSNCKVLIDANKIDEFINDSEAYNKSNLNIPIQANDLAYVIYTSGSTGVPKGVMIQHHNVNAFIHWCGMEFSTTNFDVVFGVTSICFDLSIFEIFFTLTNGKRLRLLKNAMFIPEFVDKEENILLNTVPSVVGGLLTNGVDFSNITVLNMAGEPIPKDYIEQIDCKRIEVRNLYGPSEDTTYSTSYKIQNGAKVLIGRPIANTKVFIIDKHKQLLPLGVVGELCLSGDGLSSGYLNNEKLSKEKFICHPFENSGKLYCTGDLARWMPDGNLEYLGRIDDQIKIRGYRIELGEIDNYLLQHEKINGAVSIVQVSEDGQKNLVSYFVSEEPCSGDELREFLKTELPHYMLPNAFVQLDKIPLTSNGKIDKKNLPKVNETENTRSVEYVPAGNKTEERLIAIFEANLKRDKIGILDSFFDMGGDSLKAMVLLAKIGNEFSIEFSLKDFFDAGNIQEIAVIIDDKVWSNELKEKKFSTTI